METAQGQQKDRKKNQISLYSQLSHKTKARSKQTRGQYRVERCLDPLRRGQIMKQKKKKKSEIEEVQE